MQKNTLYLLPNILSEDQDPFLYIPPIVKDIALSLDCLIAESEKNARAFLLRYMDRERMQQVKILPLNEHSTKEDIVLLSQSIKNLVVGLISDAGLPCLADPGAHLVFLAKKNRMEVRAISGPSSIVAALQLSGFVTQKFSFHGYLPREEELLKGVLKKLEKIAFLEKAAQVFIEAPYRSHKLYEAILLHCNPALLLSMAIEIGSKEEQVITENVASFKKMGLELHKKKVVFSIYSF